jgi:hypothetical protein
MGVYWGKKNRVYISINICQNIWIVKGEKISDIGFRNHAILDFRFRNSDLKKGFSHLTSAPAPLLTLQGRQVDPARKDQRDFTSDLTN